MGSRSSIPARNRASMRDSHACVFVRVTTFSVNANFPIGMHVYREQRVGGEGDRNTYASVRTHGYLSRANHVTCKTCLMLCHLFRHSLDSLLAGLINTQNNIIIISYLNYSDDSFTISLFFFHNFFTYFLFLFVFEFIVLLNFYCHIVTQCLIREATFFIC